MIALLAALIIFTEAPKAIFWNSYTAAGPAANVWHTLDMTQFGVPATAKAVFLQGGLNITGGLAGGICNSYFFVRKDIPFDPKIVYWFGMGQAMTSLLGEGDRKSIATFVPLVNGEFAWTWTRNTQGEWPEQCSYGGNFNIQGYVE